MISNLKRHKNLIEQFTRQLKKATASPSYQQFLSGVCKFRKIPQPELPSPPDYGLWYPVFWKIEPSKNLITYEEDGIVYIGPDLDVYSVDVTSAVNGYGDSMEIVLVRIFYDRLLGYYWKNKQEMFDNAIAPHVNFTLDDYSKDEDLIKGTVPFKEAEKTYQDVLKNANIDISLKSGEWPKLSNRKIYPLLTLDFNKYEIVWINDAARNVTSYRKGVKKCSFDNWNQRNASYANLSRSLVTVKRSLSGFECF